MLVFVTICSLGISTGFGKKKKNSVTHSLFTMQSSLFSLNLSLFPLFVLGKHFIFILHLAFSQYESFAESVVGFNFIIGFWFSYNVSYVIFLDFFVSSDLYLHVSILLPLRNHNDLSPFHHYLPLSFLNLFMIFKHIICSRMLFLMSSRWCSYSSCSCRPHRLHTASSTQRGRTYAGAMLLRGVPSVSVDTDWTSLSHP